MKNRKTRFYLILALLLIAVSICLPFVINLASDSLVRKILKQPDAKAETERETESDTELMTKTQKEAKEETIKMKGSVLKEASKASDSGIPDGDGQKKEPKESETASREFKEAKDQYSRGMKKYVREFKPENIFYINMEKEDKEFLKSLEDSFLKSVAEYIYSLYGEGICITKIVILGRIEDNEDEYAFYFVTETDDDESEGFYCLYDKKMDYFKLYSMFMN